MTARDWKASPKDHWVLGRSIAANMGMGHGAAALYEAQRKLAEVQFRQSWEGREQFERAWEAKKDSDFQAFLLAAGATPPPKVRKARRGEQS